MLGILFNNIIHESAKSCDKYCDYEMCAIEYSKVKAFHNKKSLKK
ncbi:hypothetical protein [Acanthamoeba castellanii mimivirus]|uniref:Uncharacterized protein n=1 Tax=Acanthamoeba castellanii mimivirus TaxID=1899318 RepID=A0A1E1EUS3_9VIRU|nr:hypothetical protein [Acanthamoeba castellanii mimivirus]BAV62986.1 hypothetical protein [Acanthamoeba castellanii mimivirus]